MAKSSIDAARRPRRDVAWQLRALAPSLRPYDRRCSDRHGTRRAPHRARDRRGEQRAPIDLLDRRPAFGDRAAVPAWRERSFGRAAHDRRRSRLAISQDRTRRRRLPPVRRAPWAGRRGWRRRGDPPARNRAERADRSRRLARWPASGARRPRRRGHPGKHRASCCAKCDRGDREARDAADRRRGEARQHAYRRQRHAARLSRHDRRRVRRGSLADLGAHPARGRAGGGRGQPRPDRGFTPAADRLQRDRHRGRRLDERRRDRALGAGARLQLVLAEAGGRADRPGLRRIQGDPCRDRRRRAPGRGDRHRQHHGDVGPRAHARDRDPESGGRGTRRRAGALPRGGRIRGHRRRRPRAPAWISRRSGDRADHPRAQPADQSRADLRRRP